VQPIATDEVTWSVGLSVCQVFLFVTTVSPAKTVEPTEMLVGMWTRVGPRNYVLDRVQKGRPPLEIGKICTVPTYVREDSDLRFYTVSQKRVPP